MKKSLLLLLSFTSISHTSEQKNKRDKKTVFVKTSDEKEVEVSEQFLSNAKTLNNLIQDLKITPEEIERPIPLSYIYCTKKYIKQLNTDDNLESDRYKKLPLLDTIKCYLAASFLQFKDFSILERLIAQKMELSKNIQEKIDAQSLIYQDQNLTTYLSEKWGIYFDILKEKSTTQWNQSPFFSDSFLKRENDDNYCFTNFTNSLNQKLDVKISTKGGSINCADLNKEEKQFAYVIDKYNNNKELYILNLQTERRLRIPLNINRPLAIKFFPQKNLIAFSYYNEQKPTLTIYDFQKKEEIKNYKSVEKFIIHPDENILFYFSQDTSELHRTNLENNDEKIFKFDYSLTNISLSPNKTTLLLQSNTARKKDGIFEDFDGKLLLLNANTLEQLSTIPTEHQIISYDFLNSGKILFSCFNHTSSETTTYLWNITENNLTTIEPKMNVIVCKGNYIYGYNRDTHRLIILDKKTFKPAPFYDETTFEKCLPSFHVSPNGNFIYCPEESLLYKKIEYKDKTLLELLEGFNQRKEQKENKNNS